MKKNFAKSVVTNYLESDSLSKMTEVLFERMACESEGAKETRGGGAALSMAVSYRKAAAEIKEGGAGLSSSGSAARRGVGEMRSEKGSLADKDGEVIHRHGKDEHPLRTGKAAIPVVVSCSTGEAWFARRSKADDCSSVLVKCELDRTKDGVLHCGAWHFRHLQHGSSVEIDTGNLHREGYTCGLMLQHETDKRRYYTVRTDWKEMIAHCEIDGWGSKQSVFFAYPRYRLADYKDPDH